MIAITERDGIARLEMRHGKANALDLELCRELVSALDRLRDAPARAVVLTGQGKIFSAGVDLRRILSDGPDYVREFLPAFHDFGERLFSFPKPVVAGINGHAIAGGFILACTADRRILARGPGRIGLPELLVGVPFPPVATEIVRFAVPGQHLSRVMYGGTTYEPEGALAQGLVDELVEPAELLPRAEESARELGEHPAETFALTKAQIRGPALAQLRSHQRELGERLLEIWTAPATLDRIRRYVERTFRRNEP